VPSSKNPDSPRFAARLEDAKRESTLQLLFKAARLLNEEALVRVASRRGRPSLRPSHTNLFPHIDLEGTRIVDLAARVGVTKQAVSQLVDELEAFGAVERVPDPADGRAKLVRFTKQGRKGLLDGLSVLRELEEELAGAIGTTRMRQLHEALALLVDRAMDESEP
jgi:DNA-binding MarR family transcriptional regulator